MPSAKAWSRPLTCKVLQPIGRGTATEGREQPCTFGSVAGGLKHECSVHSLALACSIHLCRVRIRPGKANAPVPRAAAVAAEQLPKLPLSPFESETHLGRVQAPVRQTSARLRSNSHGVLGLLWAQAQLGSVGVDLVLAYVKQTFGRARAENHKSLILSTLHCLTLSSSSNLAISKFSIGSRFIFSPCVVPWIDLDVQQHAVREVQIQISPYFARAHCQSHCSFLTKELGPPSA